ncbi:MAG: glycosyltransferase family 4 protein [Bacteroidales bacterium]|nr:glycosyltransferase family 4 protein [Bacteroidales bacterium]MBN2756362.1 glycosyltransferase family 4 protein [Bacteroidales bacterium]
MNILLINKSDKTGGAAVACKRLKDALNKNGITAKMLVMEKLTSEKDIYQTSNKKISKYYYFLLFVAERIFFAFYEVSKKVRFAFSPANTGINISKNKLVKNADVIHIHWFNQGFLSINNLKQILDLNIPVVLTLHDMWAFTGGCHYSSDCLSYKNTCGNCKFLKKNGDNDLSHKILQKKLKLYSKHNISIVTCSKWLKEKAQESTLLNKFKIINIPNPINQEIYLKKENDDLKRKLNLPLNKKLILFGSANIMDERKGFHYLKEALLDLNSDSANYKNEIELVVFGKSNSEYLNSIPFIYHDLGIIKDENTIVDIYNIADLFVLPSLEDNLPNTIMESLACGTPVVAFNTGGIPEMINHRQNGYIAEYKSITDLKEGIKYLISHKNIEVLSKKAIIKVNEEYNEKIVARQYSSLYKSIIK